jgi:TonB family protein
MTTPRLLLATILFSALPGPADAMRPAAIGVANSLRLQESGTAAPLGKLNVPAKEMAGRCITMVSPNYPPQTGDDSPRGSTVVVRAVIWKSGSVTPMRTVSGPPSLEAEAMDAVRMWRYKPYIRDGDPLDVTTDIYVTFEPGKPGGIVTHPNQ